MSSDLAFIRLEGNVWSISPFRVLAHLARNAQAFTERTFRVPLITLSALARLPLSLEKPDLATRLLYVPLRGMSRDRLDLLGEEYFDYILLPRLIQEGLTHIKSLQDQKRKVVFVSDQLEHLVRPLARHLGVDFMASNRLEFRDDLATGRLLEPVIPALGGAAKFTSREREESETRDAFNAKGPSLLFPVSLAQSLLILPTRRSVKNLNHPIVQFSRHPSAPPLMSVRESLKGKRILLIGCTGFIGKVWLTMLLEDLPEIGRIFLLIRRHGARSALHRFERIVAESPTFKILHERYGDQIGEFLADRIEVIEGDVSEPQLGLDPPTALRLQNELDLIVNSAGLTDFNPDLRLAVSTNTDSVMHLVEFMGHSKNASLLHVSTCFVNGRTDGRVPEELPPNYTPKGKPEFDALSEWRFLHQEIERVEEESESPTLNEQFRAQASSRKEEGQPAGSERKDNQSKIRKLRTRWVRDQLIELGIQRAQYWGWPNIYTFTKSLGESLLATQAASLPFSIARPSIVESSVSQPFRGWNEGVNTTAPLSYLLGTYFRQLPSNEKKRLDVIPVDLVCRGLTLMSAALVQRNHETVYQLATSATNPANMRRTIELTALAHRKHYRSLEGLEHWLRARMDAIAVSKTRYRYVSLPGLKGVLQSAEAVLSALAYKGDALIRKQRALERVQKVIELYEPFILDNEYYFAADHIKALSDTLPDEEIPTFGYDATSIDWYDYWINLHVPALRRWTYPLIEGRRPETGLLPRNFKLPVKEEVQAPTNGEHGNPSITGLETTLTISNPSLSNGEAQVNDALSATGEDRD
ncbi:MAG: SDR family oxidoreductase [Terriglobia bacterium]